MATHALIGLPRQMLRPQWWESDLEGVYVLSAVTLRFANPGGYSYEIQTSTDDRVTWHTVCMAMCNSPDAVTVRSQGTGTSGIRIVFNRTPEALRLARRSPGTRGSPQ